MDYFRSYTGMSYAGMRSRCNNPNSTDYARYGGRGIKVCPEWDSIKVFFADMGERPEGATLDRIDNNGNYEPSNCRWATHTDQARNRTNNTKLTFNGESMIIAEWAEKTGVTRNAIYKRLEQGWSVDKTLTTPVRKRKRYNHE